MKYYTTLALTIFSSLRKCKDINVTPALEATGVRFLKVTENYRWGSIVFDKVAQIIRFLNCTLSFNWFVTDNIDNLFFLSDDTWQPAYVTVILN